MRITDLDQITNEAIDLSQELAIDDPSQTFKLTLLQLRDFFKAYLDQQYVNVSGDAVAGNLSAYEVAVAAPGDTATAKIQAGTAAGMMMSLGGVQKWFAYVDDSTDQFRIARYVDGVYTDVPLSISVGGAVNLFGPTAATAQGTEAGSLTRKDYVDGAFGGKAWNNVWTGQQTFNANTPESIKLLGQGANGENRLAAYTEDGVTRKWYIGHGNSTADILYIYNDTGATSIALRAGNIAFTGDPQVTQAQGTSANSLTRKDYVDSKTEEAKDYTESYAARKRASIASGGNFSGYTMACVNMSVGGRTYPLVVPLVAGTYWVRERGGEQADRDSDFGVTVGGTAPNFTFTAVNGSVINPGATVGTINAW